LHSDSEQRFEIVFRETYHGLFQFLLHASILAYCKKFFNMLYSAQYLENRIVYGLDGAGPSVKTRPCCSRCTRLCAVTKARHHWLYGFRKCSRTQTELRKSLRPCGYVPRGVASKDAGVAGSQDAHRKLWAIHPFAQGMEPATGMAPPRKQRHEWMRLFPRFSLSTTVCTESRPRRSSQCTDYAREAEAPGLASR
jgi:hypothetical protein